MLLFAFPGCLTNNVMAGVVPFFNIFIYWRGCGDKGGGACCCYCFFISNSVTIITIDSNKDDLDDY